jgi:PAS domain S-box-containing protein
LSVALLDIGAYSGAVAVLILKNRPLGFRAGLIFFVLYFLGLGLIILLGPVGAGYIWLLGASIMVSTIYDLKAAFASLACNAAAFATMAVSIATGILDWNSASENLLEQWLVMSGNFLFINALVSTTTALMLNSLKQTLINEQSAKAKLQENEQRYRTLFETAKDAIFILKDNQFIDCNMATLEMFGFSDKALITGQHPWQLSPPAQPCGETSTQKAQTYVMSALEGVPQYFEWQHMKTDETVFDTEVALNRFQLGNQTYLQAIVRDITHRKQAEKSQKEKEQMEIQVQQVQKMESIGRLAGGVAHDLNNLLSPVLGYSELMLTDSQLAGSHRKATQTILDAGIRARDLVRQLLAFSRKQTLSFEPVDINQVVDNFLPLLYRTIREDITINLSLSPTPEPVMADVGQLGQVILNLAVNAADAMPDGGYLDIETSRKDLDVSYAKLRQGVTPGPYVLLSVSDTGAGMDTQTIEHIFEPFFSTKGERGTGLGLATVYGIVKQHGGNIWVYSEPEKGTTFKIYLPLASDADPVDPGIEKKETTVVFGTETILLAEDNDQVRELACTILETDGYTVLTAGTGEEALQTAAAHKGAIDLLLTDVVMPGMNGRELYDEIRRTRPHIKVVYMSGYTANVIAHHGILESGIQFIQKPFTVKTLADKVRQVLDTG